MHYLSIEHALRLAISMLIVVATILLGIGEHNAALPAVSLVAVIVSAYVTDVRGWFRLTQPLADSAAVGIILVSAFNAYHADRPGQMFVMAHLQSYLQYVLLFQPKTTRLYWQLALLSFGQMAIASTLLSSPLFGLMTTLYLFLGVFTFALLVLSVEVRHADTAVPVGDGHLGPRPAGGDSCQATPVLVGSSAVVESRAILSGILRHSAILSALNIVVSVILFFALPRWDVPNREIATTEPLRTVGFSKKVTLGELGEVVNNPDLVMRIQFFRGRESRAFKLTGEPMFRGTVVTRYEDGSWTQSDRKSVVVMQMELKSPFVRQRITAEPLDVSELFCVFPVFAFQLDYRVRVDATCEELLRQEDYRNKSLEIEIGTNGIVDDRQRTIVSAERHVYSAEVREMLQMPAKPGGGDAFPGLRAIAARVLEQRGIDPADRVAAARALNDYLSTSGQYLYSLEAQARDRQVDPLEDFVSTHRLGHCEYFAGALVMMLRSQGIPARMAIGFKGGEWNPLGMYYQVQQLHAHAWVEVYLTSDQIPPEDFSEEEVPRSAWLTLDPTQGTQESSMAARHQGFLARLRQSIDYGQVLWTNYVIGLNFKRQRQGIYDPLAQGVSAAVDNIVSRQVWQERMRWLSSSPLGTFWEWYRRHWFSWRGGLVAAAFSFALISTYLAVRWLLDALRRWGLVGGSRGRDEPVLEIYRRLEAALRARGLERQAGQTAREFALAAGGELAEDIEHHRVAHLPRRIVDTFHRVRFGGQTLDNSEAEAVEHALSDLERALGRSR